MTDDKMLARIAALLRKAEGTDNQHEADAFMAAAQRLAREVAVPGGIVQLGQLTPEQARRLTQAWSART